MNNSVENSISTKELFTQYSWYKDTFSEIVQQSCDDFFDKNFKVNFIALSKNINCLLDNEACFVTKIQIDKDYDMFFRLTDKVIEIILDKVLGSAKNNFNINKISELEAKVITSFNRELYSKLKEKLSAPNPKEIKRSNFDMINLTFILKDIEQDAKSAGKIIITVPAALLTPETITSEGDKFTEDNFPESITTGKISIGSTKFTLYELKNLEQGDTVVFENSSIDKLKLYIFGQEMDVNLNPNMNLLISEDNNGGNNMAESHNIWDNIEVEMNAEFDAVKISLKELKNIEKGIVVDLASLYDNKVTLKVENNPIASGSLVIVNDRYGVKIEEIIANSNAANENTDTNTEETETVENSSIDEETENNLEQEEEFSEEETEGNPEEEEEEFDYSDFELEDENI